MRFETLHVGWIAVVAAGCAGPGDTTDTSDPVDTSDTSDTTDSDTSDTSDTTDSDTSDTIDTEPLRARVIGTAAKGPFVRGSSTSIAEIDATGAPSGRVYLTETLDDVGNFEVTVDFYGPVRLEAQGYYYNEITGRLSAAPITLRSYGEVGGDIALHVNLLTHLASHRVRARLDDGQTLADAIAGADADVYAALDLGPGLDVGAANQLDLTAGDTDRAAYLFAVSAVIAQIAADRAGPDGPVDGVLTEIVNGMAIDLADGTLDGDGNVPTGWHLKTRQATMEPDAIEALLAARFDAIGSDATVPDLDRAFDRDLDEVTNLLDTDDDNDGVAGIDEGGLDCNDTDAEIHPAADEIWYDGIDQDCNGGSDLDQDGDTYDDVTEGGNDCDDTDPDVHPGAPDAPYDDLDADCGGGSDWDADGDGVEATPEGPDCDDDDATIHPSAAEIWYDGVDQDCSGGSDADQDGDGYDDLAHGGDDCDDADGAIHPDAYEACGQDLDCDGKTAPCPQSLNVDDALVVAISPAVSAVVTPGDLDGDGDGDLVLASGKFAPEGEIRAVAGLIVGGEAFATPDVRLTGTSAGAGYRIAVGDFDGDGDDDLITNTSWSGVALFEGPFASASTMATPAVTFTTSTPGFTVSYETMNPAGDFDGDGVEDAALRGAPASGPAVTYLVLDPATASGNVDLSATAITFTHPTNGKDTLETFAGVDHDGDGYDDAVVGLATLPGVYVIDGRAAPAASYALTAPDAAITTPASMVGSFLGNLGDADADGDEELLVTATGSLSDGGVYRIDGPLTGALDLVNDADGRLTTPSGIVAAAYVAGDLACDGSRAVVASTSLGTVFVWPYLPRGTRAIEDAAWNTLATSGGARPAGPIGDVTGDGCDDLALFNPSLDRMYVWDFAP